MPQCQIFYVNELHNRAITFPSCSKDKIKVLCVGSYHFILSIMRVLAVLILE